MKTTLLLRMQKLSMACIFGLILSLNAINLNAQGAGFGVEFDGVDDYITLPSNSGDELNPQNALTIESWIYLSEPASSTHRPHYLGKSLVYQLVIETNGLPRFYANNGAWFSTTGTTAIQTGKWYHIAATYNGTNIQIYVNGRLEGTPAAVTSPLRQNSSDVRFGDRQGGIEALAGSMDEIRIWDIARTEIEIQDAMNKKLSGTESNLVGYWQLDDGSGSIATDLTTYGNYGTLTNMDPSSDWITSIAPVGDASVFAESADITETSTCEVDVVFGTGLDAPGAGYSLAAIQVNESPNDNTGLMHSIAGQYWEIWAEDAVFDGDFTATVHFHYDNISGIPDETGLQLYRRDSANATSWTTLTGYNIITDDGGSSTTEDGLGYIQITISEATAGGFSGQYILGWNLPPVAIDDTDGTGEDTPVIIDVLANDTDADGSLDPATVTISGGPSHGTITNINNTTGEITYTPTLNYSGSDQFSYTVDDDGGATSNTALVTVNITAVNDPPVVTNIPDESVAEGGTFTSIILDDFVSDVEDADEDIIWTWSGNMDLTVTIDGSRVATIGIPDVNWNGSETITFTATDLDGGTDGDAATFTVTPVNDPPVVSDIPDQTIAEGENFVAISLDDYVSDIDNTDAEMVWSYGGNTDLTVTIDGSRVATIEVPDANWNGTETITFTATDPDGGSDGDAASFTVTPVNDDPVVSDIPDETIDEGGTFGLISLDDFVSDAEDSDADIVWTYSGNTDLTVTIDGNRVATIGVPDEDWNGTETITFTATDLDGASASDDAAFTVSPVNDAPIVLTQIPDTLGAAEEAFVFQFDTLTFGDVDEGDSLKYAAGLISGDLPAWLSFNAATRTFSGTPASEDRGFYNVVVTAFDRDMEFTTDTFEVHITGPLGITDLADEWNLNVYPNPTDGIFYVNIDLPEIEDVELKIYTPVGRLVLNEKYRHQLGNTRLSVNLTGYKKGMYIVQIATKSGVASKQIILR